MSYSIVSPFTQPANPVHFEMRKCEAVGRLVQVKVQEDKVIACSLRNGSNCQCRIGLVERFGVWYPRSNREQAEKCLVKQK